MGEPPQTRAGGHDHCVIRLCPGTIHGLDIDTRFFTGNFPPAASLEVCNCEDGPGDQGLSGMELLPEDNTEGRLRTTISNMDSEPGVWTHLRLNIYPDGGMSPACASIRSGALRLEPGCPGRVGGPGRDGPRRKSTGLQRHALRPHVQPDRARPRRQHG